MNKKNNLKSLCACSVLAALFVALEWVATTIGVLAFADNYQIPISCLPLIIASVMFGPVWGTFTGIVGSFLSQVISPYGLSWETPLWMIPTIIYSLSVAILFIAFKRSYKPHILAIQFVISSLILSFLNTAAYYYYNIIAKLSNILLAIALPFKLIMAIVFAIIFALIIPPIINRIKRFFK